MTKKKVKLSRAEKIAEKETKIIMKMIKKNAFPLMVEVCNGTKKQPLTQAELQASAEIIYDRTEEPNIVK